MTTIRRCPLCGGIMDDGEAWPVTVLGHIEDGCYDCFARQADDAWWRAQRDAPSPSDGRRPITPRGLLLAALVAAVIAAGILLLSRRADGGDEAPAASLWTRLVAAIGRVESDDGRRREGDGGRSLGRYHIGRAYWADACEQLRRERAVAIPDDYDAHVQDDEASRRIMAAYARRYSPGAWPPTTMDDCRLLARRHNGGPTGDRKRATLGYWSRVRKAM